MTNIDRIRSRTCNKCGCETCHEKIQLISYIDCLEKCLKEEREKNKKLEQRTANFEQLKENFRRYREEQISKNNAKQSGKAG